MTWEEFLKPDLKGREAEIRWGVGSGERGCIDNIIYYARTGVVSVYWRLTAMRWDVTAPWRKVGEERGGNLDDPIFQVVGDPEKKEDGSVLFHFGGGEVEISPPEADRQAKILCP
ncbi:MAG: hypothetical protein Q7R85_00125 [bacterium]|nr:hypothetical protein [bacterium]